MNEICLQEGEFDCGYSCLKSLLIHYHHNRDFNLLNDGYKEKMSLYDIKELGKKYNLDLEGVELESKELIFDYTYCICQMNLNGVSHFIVLCEVRKNKVKIIDPTYGTTIVTKEWFLSHFTGYSLIYKSHQKISFKKSFNLGFISYLLLYSFTLLIDYAFVYLLSYLLKNEGYFWLLLLTLLGLSISFGGKVLVINANYKFIDKKVLELIKKDHKITKYELNNLLSLKPGVVSLYYNSINLIAVIIFITVLLIENSVLNVLLILGIILFYLVYDLINKKYHIDFKYLLIYEENNLFNEKEKIKVDNFSFINRTINKLVRTKTFYVVILNVVSVFYCFMINYFNKLNSLAYILFSSCLFFVLIDRFNVFFEGYTSKSNEFNKYKNTFCRLNDMK